MSYDYKEGKKRIEAILDNDLTIIEKNELPNDDNFTFENGYYSLVTAIFVDIRNSTELFNEDDKEKVSKIIRCFTSEIIEILRDSDNLREIGIRGDCVYAIYTTPLKKDTYSIVEKTFYVNTLLKMLNKLYNNNGWDGISAGIGISTARELVVKAGRKGIGINNKVWIGDAVTKASNLSSLGSNGTYKSIILSNCTYINTINAMIKDNGEKAKSWFTEHYSLDFGTFYDASLLISGFDNWIESGMKD